MLKVVIALAVVLLALWLFFPDQMEEAVDEVQDTVEEVTDNVNVPRTGGGGGQVTMNPSDTTELELALLDAAAAGDDNRVADLIGQGANVNGRRTDGSTPLMVAADGQTAASASPSGRSRLQDGEFPAHGSVALWKRRGRSSSSSGRRGREHPSFERVDGAHRGRRAWAHRSRGALGSGGRVPLREGIKSQ